MRTKEQKWKGKFLIGEVGSCNSFAIELESLDWSIVENQAEVTFTRDQRNRIVAALQAYFIEAEMEKSTPQTKSVNRRLDAIARNANGLADALAATDRAGEEAIYAALQHQKIDLAAFNGYLRELATAARGLRAERASGRPEKLAIRGFVDRLHEIWREAGGTGSLCWWEDGHGARPEGYHGAFFAFVLECIIEIAGEDWEAERAIDGAIRDLQPAAPARGSTNYAPHGQ